MLDTNIETPKPKMEFRSDELRAMFVENQDDLASPEASKNIFGFDNNALLAQGNDGMHAGLAGHAEDGLKLTEEQLKEKERKRDAAEAFLDGISDLEIKLSELTQRVDTKISFFQGQLAINTQQINNTNLAIANTNQALDVAKEDTRLATMRLIHGAEALSVAKYEALKIAEQEQLQEQKMETAADTYQEAIEASDVQSARIAAYQQYGASRVAGELLKDGEVLEDKIEALESEVEIAKEEHADALSTQTELESRLSSLQGKLQDLQENHAELGETLEGYEAFKERLEDPAVKAQLESGELKIEDLQREFDALERGEPHTPTINAEIAVASNDPNAPSGTTLETEEIGSTGLTQDELSAQAVQQQLADGTLKTGELAASGVDAKTATQFEGRDLGDNSPLTDTRDGVVEVAQKIDTAVVTAERTGTSASGSEIARKVEVGQAFAKAHDHVVPTEPAQTANYNYAPTLQTQTFS